MLYQCTTAPGAAPCISDSRFDPDLKDGTINGKVVRTCKHVKKGATVRWVDPASRKHFKPADDEARAQDKKDHAWLLKELTAKGCKFPADVTLSELGETFNKLDTRLKHIRRKDHKTKKRSFDIVEKVDEKEEQELTNAQLRAILNDRGVEYPPQANKAKLKELVAGSEDEEEEE